MQSLNCAPSIAGVSIVTGAFSGAATSIRDNSALAQCGLAQRTLLACMTWRSTMIGIGRSIRISGDPMAAMAFAKDMVEHIKKWPGVTRAVCWQGMSGPTGTLVFFSECADLAALDKINTCMAEDKAYWGKIAEARKQGLFDLSSSQDMLMRQI
jgi:hypothetical protein